MLAVAVLVGWSGCSPFQGGINHGIGGNGGGNGTGGGAGGGGGDDGSPPDLSVDQSGDGGTAYNADFAVNSMCVPPQMATQCPNPIPSNAGCKAAEDCGADGSGNGLDDNCNGTVDEGCPCRPAPSRSASLGPPGRRNVGACTDGNADLRRRASSARGARASARSARRRRPATSSTTTATAAPTTACAATPRSTARRRAIRASRRKAPYTDVPLKGELFFPGAATSWSWTDRRRPVRPALLRRRTAAPRRRASRSPAPP